ncbi:metal ABC transporter solute-binding protein, Zn/Mn family [Helcococcus bovis]|uniref:metal ABC transporter solute-binding protein, Zn/Mn family n=1 Tax=Helcococcus bovis TaxID=3153252 RepID=UPI0038BD57A8
MKKSKHILFSMILLLSLVMVGCQVAKPKETKMEKGKDVKTSEKKTVTVTTSFLQDMVNVLVGDKVNTELVIPAGEDPHLYVAKPEDLGKIQKADLLLYHGLHFEGKMVEVLEKKGVAVSKDFDKSKINQMEEDGKMQIDPHFWFDLGLYKDAFTVAKDSLVKLLPDEKENLEKNYKEYISKLDELDKENKEKLGQIPAESRYLITPHDAFQYFSKAYKIEVMAPQGVSTDSEVANKEIEDTAKFIADHKIKAIFAESTTNPERMKKLQDVVKSKGFDVKVVSGENNELFSDSLAPKGEKGDNFLDMYRHNVELIVKNLK